MKNHSIIFGHIDLQSKPTGNIIKTGLGWHAGEYPTLHNLTYGVFIYSKISYGRVLAIDSSKAAKVQGAVTVLCYLNRPEIIGEKPGLYSVKTNNNEKDVFYLFADDKITYYHQPIALVIAESFEVAVEAAKLVKITYREERNKASDEALKSGYFERQETEPELKNKVNVLQSPGIKIENEYNINSDINDYREMHASLAVWDNTYANEGNETSSTTKSLEKLISSSFGLREENTSVVVAFEKKRFHAGSKHVMLEMASFIGALKIRKPLLVLANHFEVFNMERQQNQSIEKVELYATLTGVISHINLGAFAAKPIHRPTCYNYVLPALNNLKTVAENNKGKCSNEESAHNTQFRKDGIGSFGVESALDELSCLINMDPLQLRMQNLTQCGLQPASAESDWFLTCLFSKGAKIIRWSDRNLRPVTASASEWQLGKGMSTGILETYYSIETFVARFTTEGNLELNVVIGNTSFAVPDSLLKIAAAAFDIDVSHVYSRGAYAVANDPDGIDPYIQNSIPGIIRQVINNLKEKLKDIAVNIANSDRNKLLLENGILYDKNIGVQSSLINILEENNLNSVEVQVGRTLNEKQSGLYSQTICTHFAEVLVHAISGKIKVSKMVTTIDAGRISNIKETASKIYDLMKKDIERSIHEDHGICNRHDWYLNNNENINYPPFAEFVPIEVIFINEQNDELSDAHLKKVIAITVSGVAASIGNAVYNATGKRVRSLPIRI